MIVHIITGLSRGGAETALYRLLSQEPDPSRVQVVSLSDEGVFGERLRLLGIGVTCLNLHPRLPSLVKFIRLIRMLRQWQPQLVQTWMYHADLFGGLAAKTLSIPVCWGVRHTDLSVENNKPLTRLLARICAIASTWVPARIISCSQRGVDVHRALGYAAPFTVVPNGLDLSEWSLQPELRQAVLSRLALPNDAFVFAHAGRADPQKDHSGLARAFNIIHSQQPNVWLVMCGRGLLHGDPYLEALPFTQEARLQVLPMGPRDDLATLWQAADAFVMSSLGEGFPNVVAEAMACGLPCVVTDVGDAAEIVGDTGIVIRPSDSEALADAMLKMIKMPAFERSHLAITARERIKARFTLEKMVNGFRCAWSEVLIESSERCAD
jgi:glycosyltransferase involved in cell wall biosynthesis